MQWDYAMIKGEEDVREQAAFIVPKSSHWRWYRITPDTSYILARTFDIISGV